MLWPVWLGSWLTTFSSFPPYPSPVALPRRAVIFSLLPPCSSLPSLPSIPASEASVGLFRSFLWLDGESWVRQPVLAVRHWCHHTCSVSWELLIQPWPPLGVLRPWGNGSSYSYRVVNSPSSLPPSPFLSFYFSTSRAGFLHPVYPYRIGECGPFSPARTCLVPGGLSG